MSKPNSGYFIGTAGSNNTFKNLSQKEYKSVIILPKGIDTREHATKYKQLSSNRRKILHKKEDNRTITKEEYRRLNWQRRLDKRRRDGIEAFWEAEADRINRKLPTTRNWTVTQREAILNGLRPKAYELSNKRRFLRRNLWTTYTSPENLVSKSKLHLQLQRALQYYANIIPFQYLLFI